VDEGKKPQRLRDGKPRKKTKGRRTYTSSKKLTHLGEKTLKANPGPQGLGLDITTKFSKK
jgi:hypothetical protein